MEKKGRLILFVGVYDTLDIFMYDMEPVFEQLGYETMLFDSKQMEKSLGALSEFVQSPVTAAITFNNLGYNMEVVPGKNIWDELDIWCINILMDHPFCYKKALDASPAKGIILCTDRNHMRYVQRFYPKIAVTGYLPHGGRVVFNGLKKIQERTIDILYVGGLSRNFAKNVMPDFNKITEFDAKSLADETLGYLIEHPGMTTEAVIEKMIKQKGIPISEERLCEIIAQLHYVDLIVTSYYREKVLQTIAESGLPLYLYGSGWEECEWLSRKNVHFGGRIPAKEAVKKMQDAKIVLNTMTWFKDGTHDRVFNGMLAGAAVATDSSVYMREEFVSEGEEAELIMFELEEINKLPEQLEKLLQNTDELQQIADRGQKKAGKKHTLRCRAEELCRDLLGEL